MYSTVERTVSRSICPANKAKSLITQNLTFGSGSFSKRVTFGEISVKLNE